MKKCDYCNGEIGDYHLKLIENSKTSKFVKAKYHIDCWNRIIMFLEKNRCKKCNQINWGQTGEYPCEVCGLPTLHDESYKKYGR